MSLPVSISINRLKEVLRYDPDTGLFTWLVNRGPARIGATAGGALADGYLRVRVDDVLYRTHKLAWLYMTGTYPTDMDIDHKDGVRSNNKWSNLRLATRSQNMLNSKRRVDNTSGVKGVYYDKIINKWTARVAYKGKEIRTRHLTLDEAVTAVQAHRVKLHGEFVNHGRMPLSA